MSADQVRPHQDPGARIAAWFEGHQKQVTWAATGAAIVAGSIWFIAQYQKNRAGAAASALESARASVQSGNLPLAASDLSRVVATYRGTPSADEAAVVLAQVRLKQNQPQMAADELQVALSRGLSEQFQAPAYGLLGTALEDVGNAAGAAEAFESAAEASWYDFLAAEYLVGAGRNHAVAGDTGRALAIYERVARDYEATPAANEARLRAAELRAASGSS